MNNDERLTDEELYNQINEKTNHMLSDEEIKMMMRIIRDRQDEIDKMLEEKAK